MIKLEQLRQFLVVSQCNSLMDAADKLHRTPSAVSMTLKQIETRLGGPLFEGDRKRDLTPLGRFVYTRAERSVSEHQRMIKEIESYAKGDTGLVRIAAVPSAATQQLPEAIANCQQDRPTLHIELHDTDSKAVHAAVLSGNADLGVASLPFDGSSLAYQQLASDAFVCVCNAKHPLARSQSPLSWSSLAKHRFIHNGLCEQIEHPTVSELSANAHLRVYNIASLLAFVRKDMGVTLLPEGSVTDCRNLVTRQLRDKSATRNLYLLRRTDQTPSPAVRELTQAIIEQFTGSCDPSPKPRSPLQRR
ncbi:LysR family transcriptional regulator [Granulosicoccus antarcticus]|nr:LysR family transcriptional regulator [Granulosicoccus antarcticus]